MKALLGALLLLVALTVPVRADGPLGPGAMLPDFTETTVGGNALSASGLRRPVVIWFSNFSDGSNAGARALIDLCQKHSSLNLLVVSLNGPFDGKAKLFANQFNMPEQVAIDGDGSTVRLFTGAFVEGGIPLYNLFIFDGQGKMTGRCHYPGIPPALLERELLRL